LITPATLALSEGQVAVKSVGLVNVKGLGQPIEVFELVGAETGRTRFSAAARRGLSRFVGREAELDQLGQCLIQAGTGHGQVVAVVGEPGVGKSRLCHEFTRSRRMEGWLVLTSGSVSYGRATPYLPIIDLLRSYFKIEERDDIRALRAKVTGNVLALDRALEDCIDPVLWLLEALTAESPYASLDPPQRRQRTLEAVKRLLLRETQARPLVAMFEDLHWIDSETQAFLDSLVDTLPAARLLLLVNYRPEYRHGWGHKTYYHQLRVDPLPALSAEALLDSLVGDHPSLRRVRQLLISRTEGNPLFLEESVRTLMETGVLGGERGALRLTRDVDTMEVPVTVRAILAARIDRLAPEDKRLVQAAAVIGTEVPWPLLLAIADLREDDLRGGLARLQAAEFLYETRLYPDLEYTFKHALTHEVAYGSLLHDRRRFLHARIMEAIERLAAGHTAEHAASLARHALRGERWDEALAYARQAATRAQAQSAYREAIGCLEQALEALGHVAPAPATVEHAIDVRLELRNGLFGLGDHRRTLGLLEEAVALARRADDRSRLARATVLQGLSLWANGEHARATASACEAQVIAAELGDDSIRVIADFYLGVTHYAVGKYRVSVSHLARNVAALTGERADERFGLMGPPAIFCRTFLAWSLAELDELEQACARGLEAVAMADRLGEPYPQQVALMGMAWSFLRRGEPARALPALERAMDLSERWALPFWLPTVASEIGDAYVLSGRAAEALPLLERGVREAITMGMRGNLPLILTRLGEGLLSLGKVIEARIRAEEALGLAVELGERGHEAWALRLLGDIEAATGEDEVGAAARYGAALALAEQLEMRPLVAHCHLGLGKLSRRTGQREQAREHLTTATAMYRDMGMTYWLEKAEAEMEA
jgi:tetratricopeptide (TPR) repeat protein